MNITGVTTRECFRYIPMKGLDSVEEALNTFAGGFTSGSRATEQHQIEAIGQSQGGLAQAFYLFAAPHLRGADNDFVQQRIMKDARMALRERNSWSKHFDYGGMGSFFKTSVDIEVLDRNSDLYALGIYAAYVGDKPEEGLAEHLGVPRTLIWASVELETEPINGDRFEFDFETILRKLDNVLGTEWASGEQVAEAMMTVNRYGESKAFFVLYKDDVTVLLCPGAVYGRFDYPVRRGDKPIDTWEVQGSVMRGRLRESYEEKGKMASPTIEISLRSAHMDEYGYSLPIWEPEKKACLIEIRDSIATAFRP